MRIHIYRTKDGRVTVSLRNLLLVMLLTPALLVASMEVFWYFFTGGFSPLMGGFALIAGILTVIRIIGESHASAQLMSQTGLDSQ